jgi:peroxiredoxin
MIIPGQHLKTAIAILTLAFLGAGFGTACKKSSTPTGPTSGTIELGGTITMGGQAQAGVTVYLSWGASKSTATGADGKFSFKDLPAGQYLVTPSKAGTGFSPSNYEVGSTGRTDLNFSAAAASFGSGVGQIAANFAAKDQNGNTLNLYDYHGKVVLMDFTADWCVPCRAKAEHAEEFYQQYKDRGFIYILVLIDGDPAVWAHTYGLTFPIIDDRSQVIYNIFRQTSIPLPHVLDRNMTIRYKVEGWNQGEVEDWLKKLL